MLSFEKAPPFTAPVRFFLTGPLFAAAAGLLVAGVGEAAFASRWMPAALAATHLLTLGFMLQIMLGALIQILPVVAGAHIAHPLPVARGVHAGLSLGTVALVAGFLAGSPLAFQVAALLLLGAVALFLAVAGSALWRVPTTSPTIRGLKLALGALAVVIGLGAVLAFSLAHGWALPLPALTDLHAAWGLGAWAGALLVAIAYVVVPMFQLTPGYPARLSWHYPVALAAIVVVWSLAVGLGEPLLMRLAQGLAAACGLVFAGYTLRLQFQRRRARADATYRYWQLGLVCALLAMAMLLASALVPNLTENAAWTPLFGILLGVGGFLSFITGMLYKIVPFLSWMHLQSEGQGKVLAPNMNKILAEVPCQRQMWVHALALVLLAAAALLPEWLARPAGIVFMVSNLWLFANLLLAFLAYRRHGQEIARKVAG